VQHAPCEAVADAPRRGEHPARPACAKPWPSSGPDVRSAARTRPRPTRRNAHRKAVCVVPGRQASSPSAWPVTPEAAGSSPVAPVSRSGLLEPNPRPARAAEQAKAVPPAKRAGGRFGALAGHESNAAPGSSQAWSARRTPSEWAQNARWADSSALGVFLRRDSMPCRPGPAGPFLNLGQCGSVMESAQHFRASSVPIAIGLGSRPRAKADPRWPARRRSTNRRARSRSWPGGVSL
jgi:hypothetical protein